MPALGTMICRPPCWATVWSTRLLTCSSLRTSQAMADAPWIRDAVSLARPSSMSDTTTVAPSAA
jgi:hypothetical protein